MTMAMLVAASISGKRVVAQTALSPNTYNGSGNSVSGVEGPSTFSQLPSGTGVTFSQWNRGAGINASTATNTYISKSFASNTSFAQASDSNDYVYFIVSIDPLYIFTLNSISWATQRSSTGPTTAQWQYAVGGGSFQDIDGAKDLSAGGSVAQTVTITPAIPIVINGGTSGESAVFRVVAWGASAGGGTFRINNGTSFDALVSEDTPLPLHLLSFTSAVQNNEAVLQWLTAREINLYGFEIEQSGDARDFQLLAFVPAKNEPQNSYRFAAPLTAGTAFYRLKMIDVDGAFTYSPVQQIRHKDMGAQVLLFPNPAADLLHVSNLKTGSKLLLYDAQGRLLIAQTCSSKDGHCTLSTNELQPGFYLLSISDAGSTQTFSFQKL